MTLEISVRVTGFVINILGKKRSKNCLGKCYFRKFQENHCGEFPFLVTCKPADYFSKIFFQNWRSYCLFFW